MTNSKELVLEKSFKFFSLAETIRDMSADRSTKVGAVALDERNNVLCVGYNGFPRGVVDEESRHGRPKKYLYTSHAEENLVAQAAYTGVSLRGSTILVTSLFPCSTCSRLIIQSGVARVIYNISVIREKWEEESKASFEMFKEAGIELINYSPKDKTWEIKL